MTVSAGRYEIGPQTGPLRLRTLREGVAAKVGHDLLIEFKRWSGTVTLPGDDPADAVVEVEIETGSFTVMEGTGGVAALSQDDRKDITSTAARLLEVDKYPTATFRSAHVRPAGAGGTIDGTLRLRDQDGDVTIRVSADGDSTWAAATSVVQSEFGIKPYRAFFGALRLADPVRVEVTVKLPAG